MLYKKTKTGATQVWDIEIDGNRFRTIEGQLNGKMTTSEWTITEGKNVGRANETSPEQQATNEANAKHKKKLESGYVSDINMIDEAKEIKISPMLAHKYDDYFVPSREKFYYSQPKLDGMRMVVNIDGMFSRGGKPVISVPHISVEISKFFEEFGDTILLDGEIYNHDLKSDFNKLISYAKKTKPKPEDLVESEKYLQYHIYDIQDKNNRTLSFKERSERLNDIFSKNNFKYLKFVETTLVENDEHLNNLYGQYLEDGYEGQMVRVSDSIYDNDRSKSLLKRKEFIDEEFKITNITEGVGNRSGMMGRIELIDKFGITFESGCRGNHEYYKDLLLNKNNYIGKTATVRYQNKTPDGSYRFPVVINIGREDYE